MRRLSLVTDGVRQQLIFIANIVLKAKKERPLIKNQDRLNVIYLNTQAIV